MRRTSLVLLAAASALLAAGCGLTDDGARPGVAAEVDGQTLELSKVDKAVEDYCGLLAKEPGAPTYPKAVLRAQVAWNWAQAVAIEDLAPAYSVDLPSGVERDLVESAWGEDNVDDDNYDSFEWLTWIQLHLDQPLSAIGTQRLIDTGGQAPSPDAAQAAGFQAADEWLADSDLVLNPVFGTRDGDNGAFLDDDLSVAVSGVARKDAAIGASSKTQDEASAKIASLPASERCGPPVPGQPDA